MKQARIIKSSLPAAIDSPPRRRSSLPMSLFTAKGSSGIGCAFALGPGMPCARSVICTSAESPFVKTLRTTAVSCLVRESSSDSEHATYLGFFLTIAPDARSSVAMNLDIVAGTL